MLKAPTMGITINGYPFAEVIEVIQLYIDARSSEFIAHLQTVWKII